ASRVQRRPGGARRRPRRRRAGVRGPGGRAGRRGHRRGVQPAVPARRARCPGDRLRPAVVHPPQQAGRVHRSGQPGRRGRLVVPVPARPHPVHRLTAGAAAWRTRNGRRRRPVAPVDQPVTISLHRGRPPRATSFDRPWRKQHMVTHIGLVGLGKMGNNMRSRLRKGGIEVTGYDPRPEVTDVPSLADLAAALPQEKRVVWVMVPAGEPTRAVLAELREILTEGDIVIEGGNSHYVEDQERAAEFAERGVGYLDVGVSGGVWGLENGYGLMVGGSAADVEAVMPVFDALRPEGPREEGFVHAGGVGAGHYAKMVHNGIEYGLMQAYAEGYELLAAKSDLIDDVHGTVQAWSRGTVVRSWLLDLMVKALADDPKLAMLDDWVDDSGEGRWTVDEGIDLAVPLPVISAALFARFASRQEQSPAMKAVAALRQQFGGHAVKKAE